MKLATQGFEAQWQTGSLYDPRRLLQTINQTGRQLWQVAIALLAASDEPQVWQSHDHNGETWNAYDPVTGEKVLRASEQELRIWLEDRHHYPTR